MTKPAYSRVLVKISGQLLRDHNDALDGERLRFIAKQLKSLRDMGTQVAVVVGGGNIVRGASAAEKNALSRANADAMGMLATAIVTF